MATRRQTIDFMLGQIAAAGTVDAKKMFGEYALYCDGRLVGLVCDDRLFIKPTAAGLGYAAPCAEASPYPGAKPCLVIGDARLEDAEWLTALVRLTAAELPPPKPRSTRRRPVRRG